MQPSDPGPDTINSLETLFSLLDALTVHEKAGVTDLATETGIPKSTVHRHLTTLEHHGYVTRDNGRYLLTYRFLELGGVVRRRNTYFDEIKPKISRLAEETGEHVMFFVEENGVAVVVYRERGSQAIKTNTHVGKRFNLHHTAAGKAILSALPETQVARIVEERGLPEKTDNTIVDEQVLYEELATIRNRGYAINNEEGTVSVKAVGVPIVLRDGTLIGAISVVGPSSRFSDDRIENELAPLLLGVQNELQINLEYL